VIDFSVIAFVGPETLPLLVGAEKGFYARENLTVHCEAATGSVYQMTQLIEGGCDIAMTAVDNVVAYVEGQGGVQTERTPDLIAFLGSASEPRPLIALPEIADITALRGHRLAVDALNTGFSFLLRQMLADYGLGNDDYELAPVGAPAARWKAMESGDCVASLLSKAIATTAIEAGCHELLPEHDPWACYQGGVYCARRDWLAENSAPVRGFIRATVAATGWILDPVNIAELPRLLVKHLPHMSDAAAKAAAAEFHTPQSLLSPTLPVDRVGFQVVLDLRSKYGTPAAMLGGAEKYLDLSYYDAAFGS
jgi:ABC-type nitrate/sulfonate/bicarbonate transport system substrate-binding protein